MAAREATLPTIKLFVEGKPVPKGRPRVTAWGAFTPTRTRNWEAAIGWACRDEMRDQQPFSGAVSVSLEFTLTPTQKADADNLAKAVLDALNGIAYDDDAQVTRLSVLVQRGSELGVSILIHPAT